MSKHGKGGNGVMGGKPTEVQLTPAQLQALLASGGGIIARPEEAENRRRQEEVNRAQATLNELGRIQDGVTSLFGMMASAILTRRDMSPDELHQLHARAVDINRVHQTQKWEQVRDTLADLGIKVLGKEQSHMVWAASKFGVQLVPPEPPKLEAVPKPPDEPAPEVAPTPAE